MSRIPFVAAVVGALLIGGATTGGTHARWVQSQQLSSSSVTAGSMTFSLGTPSTLAGLNKAAGAEGQATFVATDTGNGKNLVQRITATISSTPAGVTAFVATGTTCAAASSASAFADKRPLDASRAQTYCVRVVSSATAVSGDVTLSVAGAQRPPGWTTSAQTVTIPVTINSPVPAAPTLSATCSVDQNKDATISWGSVSGATSYTVFRSDTTNADASFASVSSGSSGTTYKAAIGGSQTSFFRVKAVNAGGSSGYSNTLKIVRSGNTVTCSGVTP